MSEKDYVLQLAELIFVQHVKLEGPAWADRVWELKDRAIAAADIFADGLEFNDDLPPRLKP